MARYKLLFGSHKYENRTYQKGEELDIPVEHMERFGGPNRFDPIVVIPAANTSDSVGYLIAGEELKTESGTLSVKDDGEPKPDDEEITISDLLLKPLAEIKVQLAAVNDVETLDAVQAEERKGKQRTEVYKAIEARKKALKAG